MPSTYSSNLKIELQATGENSNTWGTITNTNLGTALEQAIVGYGNPSYASDANLTLSYTNTNATQTARALVLNVTSAVSLTTTRELVVPTIQKQYIVQNNTTGSQSITVKTLAGSGITVPNGRKAHLYVDGTNVIQMFDFVDINGGAIDGVTLGTSSPVTEAQIDNVNINGNTISSTDTNGNLVIAPNGTGDVQLDADTVRVGDSNANATITTNGTGDLILSTNSGTNSGTITIADGVDGNISVTPNGTGALSTTKLVASSDSEFSSTGALLISKGTAGQQPGVPVTGMLRYNTTSNEFEGYSGSSPSWKSVGGSAISNDTSTASDLYPSFLAATTGTAQNIYTSNARLLYKPSTGEFKALAPVASNGIFVNSTSIATNYTIAAGTNGFSVGPITVNSGITLTVASGQRHIVI